MWIVRVALDRPYTFIVLALLILILSPVVILRTPTDIIKRIVGLPGETVQIRQGLVYVNGDYTHDRNGREQGGNQL
jgi:hypothetical protein